ncbi:hypothetical protein [Mesorhizobium sp. LjRoot246]|uniref:hypothetical protein n=1 Tax=Mesorhizobium sp. LjRoot246 TaxID=3342294 RepID=UPI003ED163AC
MPVLLLRTGETSYELVVPRSFARSLHDWLVDCESEVIWFLAGQSRRSVIPNFGAAALNWCAATATIPGSSKSWPSRSTRRTEPKPMEGDRGFIARTSDFERDKHRKAPWHFRPGSLCV